MKAGMIVKLPDGRFGTVVYHGLDGYGIVFGKQEVNTEAIYECTPLFENGKRNQECPEPEAMLRNKYPSATLECVGEDYEVQK